MHPHFKRKIVKVAILAGLAILLYNGQLDIADHSQSDDKSTEMLTVVYTKHARCRMDCRDISEAEIVDVLTSGKLNERKSDANRQPCPVEAREKTTKDKQNVRIIVGNCPNEKRIITAIDLGVEHDCDCR